ncbi:MAG: hypothetical protein ACXVCT_22255 [Ktedonobacterales bacterium]
MVEQAPQYERSMTSHRNGAALLSLVCAVLWPLSFLVPAIFNVVTGGPRLPGSTLPAPLTQLFQLGFAILPVASVIAGSIGIYRALSRSELRSTLWQAVVGLALGCMWLGGVFVLSFAGVALLHWLSHLFG